MDAGEVAVIVRQEIDRLGLERAKNQLIGRVVQPVTVQARLTKTGSQTLNNSTITSVNWDASADVIGTNVWSAGTPDKILLPEAGLYLITCGLLVNNVTGEHDLFFAQYGVSSNRYAEDNKNITEATDMALTLLRRFAAGDALAVYAFQNSGGATTMGSASEQHAHLSVAKLAP